MKDSSKALTNLLTSIFVVLFIGTTGLAFVLYNVERSMFDAQLYIRSFEEEGVYQRLPDLISKVLVTAAQRAEVGNPLAMVNSLSQEEWGFYIARLFPPAEIKILADEMVISLIAHITGESDTVVLSLASLKTHLSSPQGIDTLYTILKAQPDCSIDQLTALMMGHREIFLCNPPETFLFVDLTPMIKSQISGLVALLPDQITLISPSGGQVHKVQELENLRLFMRISPILPILFLLLVTAIRVRSVMSWLSLWGYSLMLAGLFSMATTLLSKPIATLVVQLLIVPVLPDTLPGDVIEVFRGLAATVMYNAIQPTIKAASAIALTGIFMVALSLLIRRIKVSSSVAK